MEAMNTNGWSSFASGCPQMPKSSVKPSHVTVCLIVEPNRAHANAFLQHLQNNIQLAKHNSLATASLPGRALHADEAELTNIGKRRDKLSPGSCRHARGSVLDQVFVFSITVLGTVLQKASLEIDKPLACDIAVLTCWHMLGWCAALKASMFTSILKQRCSGWEDTK